MFEVDPKHVFTIKKICGKSGRPHGFDVNQFMHGVVRWHGNRLEIIGAHMDEYLITSNVISHEVGADSVITFKTESGSTYILTPMARPTGNIDAILPTE